MQPFAATQCDIRPWAPYRCPRCERYDTIPLPPAGLLDKLRGGFGYAPFKCRACRAKFYRRQEAVAECPPPEMASAPVSNPRRGHRDPAETLRRLDNIIRTAESRRLRRG
jgi:hypothetical protein